MRPKKVVQNLVPKGFKVCLKEERTKLEVYVTRISWMDGVMHNWGQYDSKRFPFHSFSLVQEKDVVELCDTQSFHFLCKINTQ